MEEPIYLSDMADILAKEKVIRQELIKPLESMIGLRNLLAHQYGDIDFKAIYNIVKHNLKDVYIFLDDIISYAKLYNFKKVFLSINCFLPLYSDRRLQFYPDYVLKA
ncbi:MAG: DUF86 domain-containing protein [Thermovenabulum sp.]|uniref:DUF86 domain-containing protein n=1 Tax=Thermovenabulum sp. TaxID=3100335 RepID=UPI003C7E87FA